MREIDTERRGGLRTQSMTSQPRAIGSTVRGVTGPHRGGEGGTPPSHIMVFTEGEGGATPNTSIGHHIYYSNAIMSVVSKLREELPLEFLIYYLSCVYIRTYTTTHICVYTYTFRKSTPRRNPTTQYTYSNSKQEVDILGGGVDFLKLINKYIL